MILKSIPTLMWGFVQVFKGCLFIDLAPQSNGIHRFPQLDIEVKANQMSVVKRVTKKVRIGYS